MYQQEEIPATSRAKRGLQVLKRKSVNHITSSWPVLSPEQDLSVSFEVEDGEQTLVIQSNNGMIYEAILQDLNLSELQVMEALSQILFLMKKFLMPTLKVLKKIKKIKNQSSD